jgi:hypothetical protein
MPKPGSCPQGIVLEEARQVTPEECVVRPSGVQPEDGLLDVFVPPVGERFLSPDWLEAASFKDPQ